MPFRSIIKSKIVVKGLAFILIPCAIDTVSCIWLLNMVAETEAMAKSEHTRMEIVRHANRIMTLYGAASGQLGTYSTTGSELALQKGREYMSKLNSEYEVITPLLVDTPKIAAS